MSELVAPLKMAEIQKFATDWYHKLDVHAPSQEFIPLLAEEALQLQFPEGTFTGFDGFENWYERVIRLFFDEVHTLKEVTLMSVDDQQAKIKVVVNWQASLWNPPQPKSERIVLDAYQTWIVERSPKTQKPVIQVYIVDSMEYAEGSARL